jgi:hypothetical protein
MTGASPAFPSGRRDPLTGGERSINGSWREVAGSTATGTGVFGGPRCMHENSGMAPLNFTRPHTNPATLTP